jgi:hypothetical protein
LPELLQSAIACFAELVVVVVVVADDDDDADADADDGEEHHHAQASSQMRVQRCSSSRMTPAAASATEWFSGTLLQFCTRKVTLDGKPWW